MNYMLFRLQLGMIVIGLGITVWGGHMTIVGMSNPNRLAQTVELLTTEIPPACLEEIMAVPIPAAEDPEKDRWT